MYQIDNQSRQSVYEQIVQQVEKYVLTGVLRGGDKIPSIRSLSLTLKVNPNTVQRAFTELERSGVLITAPGRGAFISDHGAQRLKEKRGEMAIMDLKALVSELKLSGVEKEQIIQIVEEEYQKHD